MASKGYIDGVVAALQWVETRAVEIEEALDHGVLPYADTERMTGQQEALTEMWKRGQSFLATIHEPEPVLRVDDSATEQST